MLSTDASRTAAPTQNRTSAAYDASELKIIQAKAVLVPCSIRSARARPEPYDRAHSSSAVPEVPDRGSGGGTAAAARLICPA
jgi:hypothetical protein